LSAIQLTNIDHFSLMKEFSEREFLDALKWIGTQSWIIFSDLSKECRSAESCESLFSCNKIEFCRADDYSLVQSDEYSVSPISHVDDEEDGEWTAKDSGAAISYDPNLREALWPLCEESRIQIFSIWDLADIVMKLQFSVNHKQRLDCSGGYIMLLGGDVDQKKFDGETSYNIMLTMKLDVIY
jgi:hypothetical protein